MSNALHPPSQTILPAEPNAPELKVPLEPQYIKRPPYLLNFKTRHGKEVWYVRRKGHEKIRLPCGPDGRGFAKAYYEALLATPQPPKKMGTRKLPTLTKKWKTGGYVYFLRMGNLVKIGFSTRPLQRMDELKTAMAKGVTSFVFIPGYKYDERALHKFFENRKSSGEWFRMSPTLKRFMAYAAANATLPDEMKNATTAAPDEHDDAVSDE